MLKIQGLSAGYGEKKILHALDLNVPKGQITTLNGPNGCGKSTLLKVIAGLLPTSEGKIFLQGDDLSTLSPVLRSRRIAYLPQLRSTPDLTVSRMILHGRFPYLSFPRQYRKEDYAVCQRVMEELRLTPYADQMVSQLSGGLRQKVYLAMALAQDAPLILLDEPTTFLDIHQQILFLSFLEELRSQGKTILLVLHDLLMAMKYSDQMAIMKDGKVLTQGPPSELMNQKYFKSLYGVDVAKLETSLGSQYYYDISNRTEDF